MDVLFDQRLKLRVGVEVFSDEGNLIGRDILRDIGAVLPALEVATRPVGALTQNGERSPFHVLDAGDLLAQDFWSWRGVHTSVDICTYINMLQKKPEFPV